MPRYVAGRVAALLPVLLVVGVTAFLLLHLIPGDPASVMRDYNDYMRYVQSTQGHLNSDGLCYVKRHYPSPQ